MHAQCVFLRLGAARGSVKKSGARARQQGVKFLSNALHATRHVGEVLCGVAQLHEVHDAEGRLLRLASDKLVQLDHKLVARALRRPGGGASKCRNGEQLGLQRAEVLGPEHGGSCAG